MWLQWASFGRSSVGEKEKRKWERNLAALGLLVVGDQGCEKNRTMGPTPWVRVCVWPHKYLPLTLRYYCSCFVVTLPWIKFSIVNSPPSGFLADTRDGCAKKLTTAGKCRCLQHAENHKELFDLSYTLTEKHTDVLMDTCIDQKHNLPTRTYGSC